MKFEGINSGIEFEQYVNSILSTYGFTVYDTPTSNDYGADLILDYDEYKISIQCKYYSKAVGVKAVQEVMGSLSYYNCDYGMVITNAVFTKQAENLASLNGVLLVNGDELKSVRASEVYFRRIMDKFLEQADNHEIIQKENTEWYMSDLQIRYGVSSSKILSDFLSMGLPYYKVGREYRFRPDEVIEWEKHTHKIPYGRNSIIELPGYIQYVQDAETSIKTAKREGNKEEVNRIRNEMRDYGITPNSEKIVNSLVIWTTFIILIIVIIFSYFSSHR